jgi:hypothetical protein
MSRSVVFDKGGSLSTINGLLKDHYILNQIVDVINRSTVFLSKLKTEQATHGRKFIFPVQFGVSQGVGARAENAGLPNYGFGEYEQATGEVKYLYSTFYITGQSISATRDSKTAFADALKQALKDARDGMKYDIQRQVWGDGTGVIGRVSGVHTATTTLTVKDPFGLTYQAGDPLDNSQRVRLFKRNMKVHIAAGTPQASTITAINNNGTVTLSSAITAADNNLIYRGDHASDLSLVNVDKEINGLTGMVSASGTYLGIARAGRPEWQGTEVALNGSLTEEAIRSLLDTLHINGTSEPDLLLTDHKTRRRYEKLLQGQKRFISPLKLEGGHTALEFDGLPMVVDKDAPPQRLWALNTGDMSWSTMQEIEWMNRDGAVLDRVQGRDAYEATLYTYKNLKCKRPANQGVLSGITGP